MTLLSARWLCIRRVAAVLLVGSFAAAGCGQKSQPDAGRSEPAATASASANTETLPDTSLSIPGKAPTQVVRDRLHQAFSEATRAADDPPEEANRPPDETVNKKVVFKLLDAVTTGWDTIRFVTPDGKKIHYTAEIDTNLGKIEMALFPELAPNHVRNFIALARAGYYDELFFDRVRHEEGENTELRSIEAGCPLGTGEPHNGSIGYWLKQEFTPSDKMSHDEGVVGACREEEPDTAACRFYITLNKASFMDGQYTIFAKVVQGLDVARKIYEQPVIIADQDRDGARRPEHPVVIRKVTIIERTEASAK